MGKRQKTRLRPADLIRSLGVYILPALLTLAVAAASAAYALARIVEQSRPELALSIMPSLAPSLAVKADKLLVASGQGTNRAKLVEASRIARQSLRASPLNPQALRTLAVAESKKLSDSRALVSAALGISRRDIGTQLLQIELAAASGDVPGTLRHYDQALRVKPTVGATLFPVLLSATEDPVILQGTRKMVSSGPEWLPNMVTFALDNPTHLKALTRTIGAFPARSDAMAPGYGQALVEALVQRKEFREAFAAYRAYSRLGGGSPAFSGGFTYRPLDWTVADNYESGADVVEAPSQRVRFFAEPGAEGDFLSRLLALGPGRYRVSFATENQSGEGSGTVRLKVSCQSGEGDRALSTAMVPIATRSFSHEFSIGGSCPYQWLRFSVASRQGAVAADLTRVAIARAGQPTAN